MDSCNPYLPHVEWGFYVDRVTGGAVVSTAVSQLHTATPSQPRSTDHPGSSHVLFSPSSIMKNHLTLTWSANVHCSSFALLSSLALATDDNFAMHFCCTSSVLSLLPRTPDHAGRSRERKTQQQNSKVRKRERERLSPGGNLYHDEWSGCQRGNNNTCETRRKIWATRTPCGDNAMDCEIHILIMTGILSPQAVICSSLTRGLVCIMSSKCK